ncbi:ShlB/FhaC/HecB family hemolysin secretion/activation protein [Altererythrobacter sp. KTW20L]|uniref:ShlB/FhaC/HecB family hemolysin secretion/activation protein n=1 Tax=Altererythrobacter sp. KTW20L TaxID=2942210 RepID=UPI0020C0703E|nr:ShlB/FhaC/HecB family hemolysin secretion/activation protein [Altererythrobacter sp. KTW20L]MCL6251501.1 ShlB/FhaC/HecB family hemolysin secretion/activation protein [Altererythrobacter sp. KTW20L]
MALAILAVGVPTMAQVAPPAAPTRDELVPPPARMDQRSGTTLTIDGQMARTPCALDNPDLADVRVTLSRVSFVGAEAATGVDLSPAYAPYLGRDLPIAVLCDIRASATQMLADAGYLAAVEIPEQRLDAGAATFRVVLGRLTAVRVRGEAGPSERLLASYLERLVGQPVFNTREAERYLLLADDIPGLDVRLALRPAANGDPGDLIGEVAVVRRTASVDANVQNYGSRALGRFGGLLRAELYDITGQGDRTTLSLYSSADFSEQQTVQLGHAMLVGSEGLELGGQVTLGWTNPTLGIAGFDVKSDTLYARVHARYPFLRTQARSVHGSMGLDLVDQDVKVNTTLLTRDNVRTAWLRFDLTETDIDSIARRGGYSPYEPRSRLAVGLELRKGLGVLGASRDCRTTPLACFAAGEVPSRIEQDPTAMLLRADVHFEYRPVPLFTVAIDLEGQYTRDPLPAFEELSGGSFSAGRGYDPASVIGDLGVTSRVELRYGSLVPQSLDSFALQPYVFADAATVRDRDPSQRATNPDSLLSLGGGLRFTQGRGLQGDVTLAVPLKRTDAERFAGRPRGDVRLLVSLSSRLAPWRF